MQLALDKLKAQFGESLLETSTFRGDETAVVTREKIVTILRFLKETPGLQFDMMMDLGGVDYPDREERFEVVYHLYSTVTHKRIRLKIRTKEGVPVPSITTLYKAANWFEREAFDMFGIRFDGHPNLKRILLFDEFEGHPLRKDYPVNKRPRVPTPDPLIKL